MKKLVFFLLSIIVASCTCESKSGIKTSQNQVIKDLIKKYPLLLTNDTIRFELNKTIIIGDNLATIKLFSPNSDEREENRILILENNKGEQYAVPIFSNGFRRYWNFVGESKTFKDSKYNSLFEKEFIQGINAIGLNDTNGTGYKVLFTIMHNVFACEVINEYDKEYVINSMNQISSHDLPNESLDDCEKRGRKNWESLSKNRKKGASWIINNAYFDRWNGRIYQFDFPTVTKKEIIKLNIEIYRQDCTLQMTIL